MVGELAMGGHISGWVQLENQVCAGGWRGGNTGHGGSHGGRERHRAVVTRRCGDVLQQCDAMILCCDVAGGRRHRQGIMYAI